LDSVIVDITGSAEKAWEGFKNGRYDFISSLPANQLKTIVEENIADFKGKDPKYILERNAEMITQYYLFNIHKKPFDDVKVRQAISYAIDRDKLIERVLFGQAFGPAVNGIVPPTFEFYRSTEVQGYHFDIEKAKKLLAEAGYPDGKGFPEVKLIVNAGNMRNNTVAGEIQKQLMMNLNVNITFESLPNDSKFLLQTSGGGDIFRDGWVADYPSPESFLSIFYGEPVENDTSHISYPNTQRYVNKEYDLYYEKGRDALDRDTAAAYFLKAEKILMADAPLITLWYESNYRLLSNHLVNFYVNPLRHFDFSEVDVRDPKKDEKK
jgi:oligopeptide transport system substrate-binding protein